jgi:hypothetical protein
MQCFSEGKRVPVDIADETDPDHRSITGSTGESLQY